MSLILRAVLAGLMVQVQYDYEEVVPSVAGGGFGLDAEQANATAPYEMVLSLSHEAIFPTCSDTPSMTPRLEFKQEIRCLAQDVIRGFVLPSAAGGHAVL